MFVNKLYNMIMYLFLLYIYIYIDRLAVYYKNYFKLFFLHFFLKRSNLCDLLFMYIYIYLLV